MSIHDTIAQPGPAEPPSPAPLREGDRLTREEFERRYDALPLLTKAELIEGVVHMPSPVRWNRHGRPHTQLITWLGVYEANTPGVQVGDNSSVRLNLASEPQPDATMIIDPARGGQAVISPDDYVEGGPELVAEVAAVKVGFALTTKLELYRRTNVREYLVWRVPDGAVDWFVLRQGQYDRLTADADGLVRSVTFPGLWLDAAALARSDVAAVLATLHRGLASPEHADFVRRLQPPAAGGP